MDRHVLLIFLDGVGLGQPDAARNPFVSAHTPILRQLAGGQPWTTQAIRQSNARATFIPTDPRLGMPGKPQSASGQATILTGVNVPQRIGEHYGPRPNDAIRAILHHENLFTRTVRAGKRAALLEGYPPAFHASIASGKRLPSSYQQAVFDAGLNLFTEQDIYAGNALSVDWIGRAWREHLGYADSPQYSPYAAGVRLVELSRRYTFAFFSHWLSDMIGHRGTLGEAVGLLELFDGVMAGVLDTWHDDEGLIVITSDHGNLEDMSHGKHTENDVPTVVIGTGHAQRTASLYTLADIAPMVTHFLFGEPATTSEGQRSS